MANNHIEAVGLRRTLDGATVDAPLVKEPSPPRLATGFFLMASVVAAAIFIAGTMDSQVRLAGVAMVTVVASMIVFWMVVAQPTLEALSAARAQHDLDRARHESNQQDIYSASVEREQSSNRVGRFGGILAASQDELDQEIAMLRSAVSELAESTRAVQIDAPALNQVHTRLDLVEEGQHNVAAISRLGTSGRTDRIGVFRASDVVPLTMDMRVSVERDDEIYGDVQLWRLFVKNAARNSEIHGKASELTLSSGDGRLTITDNGVGCSTQVLEQAWKSGLRADGTRSDGSQMMSRIAEAHDAFVTLQGEPAEGVRIVVDLRDLEIELRERRVFPTRIQTPHKASGGRVTTPSVR